MPYVSPTSALMGSHLHLCFSIHWMGIWQQLKLYTYLKDHDHLRWSWRGHIVQSLLQLLDGCWVRSFHFLRQPWTSSATCSLPGNSCRQPLPICLSPSSGIWSGWFAEELPLCVQTKCTKCTWHTLCVGLLSYPSQRGFIPVSGYLYLSFVYWQLDWYD